MVASDGVSDESVFGTIVWQNDSLVVVDKRPCALTVPSRLGEEDGRPCVGRWLERRLARRVWPVHRLDYEVSGAVVFALHAQAHRTASMAFESRAVRKRYQALTRIGDHGLAAGVAQTWESLLVRGKRRSFVAPHGQLATTVARFTRQVEAAAAGVFGASGAAALWDLEPLTGRAHQLRVHLANAGFPIVGDTLYGGSPLADPRQGIALRAVSLAFSDPKARQALALPEVFELPALMQYQAPLTP